jgi:dTDP-4-amino-4,6-dideoxygalactose transaminase
MVYQFDPDNTGSLTARIPVYRPKLPCVEKLVPYLREIDKNRWYSNRGMLVQAMERRIAAMLGTGCDVIMTASGWAALKAAIFAAAGPATPQRPLALMPSYTFAATAAAAESCGYKPYFLDVDEDNWMISPQMLIDHPALSSASVVIPVAAYGRGVAQGAWRQFRDATKVPVVIDAAAAFEGIVDNPSGLTGAVPVAVSFQATKVLSTGEGGAVIWNDAEGLMAVARAINFGFHGTRESKSPSFNGKMSEFHAAVGNASLDAWDETLVAWQTTCAAYSGLAETAGLTDRLILHPAIASCYALFRASSEAEAVAVTQALTERGIEHRYWYGNGLHTHQQFAAAPRDPLPHTARIAHRLVGLPTAIDLSHEAMKRIVAALCEGLCGQEAKGHNLSRNFITRDNSVGNV